MVVIHQMSPKKLSTILTNLTESAGKEDPATRLPPPQDAQGAGGGMYPRPKDSNATVGVCNRATGKVLEGTDRQTNRLDAHYSKIT